MRQRGEEMSFNLFSSNKLTIENEVIQIQKGSTEKRERLIHDYQPFIKKAASKTCKFYIDESKDEFSIGLLAFNEAIDQYKETQGSKFLTFADMVIRRRIIDYIRKEARQKRIEYLQNNSNDDEECEDSYIEQKAAFEQYEQQRDADNLKYEIELYSKELEPFGITLKALSKVSPKHFDARENAKTMARLIAEKEELKTFLIDKKQLPIKDLLNLVSCSRKTVERNRKYIIAVALIYIKDFKSLISYIDG
jgi:RNA polymerase sigma factor